MNELDSPPPAPAKMYAFITQKDAILNNLPRFAIFSFFPTSFYLINLHLQFHFFS